MSSGYLKREALIGKPVVTKNAEIIGTVSDLAAAPDGRMAIQVQRKNPSGDAQDLFVGADDIQAVADVILLKATFVGGATSPTGYSSSQSNSPAISPTLAPPPPPGTTPQSKTCQKCGFVNAPNAKFCIRCGTSLMSASS